MPQTHRLGDANTAGGAVQNIPQGTVYANNLIISVNGSTGSADASCNNNNIHCAGNWSTTGGGPTVFAENIPVNKSGDPDTCGHARATGSPNVYNDAFQGGGAMFDNNPPFNSDTRPAEAQPSPPAEYENNTTATIYVFENDEEEHAGNGPPPEVNYSPMSEIETQPDQGTSNVPTTSICSIEIEEELPPHNLITVNFVDLPIDFTWATGSPLPTFADWSQTVYISSNFTVWDMCSCAVSYYEFTVNSVQPSGYTQKEILINMCHHANTVLEPLLSAYGAFTITSGFRNKIGTSQHNKGQATDIQYLDMHTTDRTYAAKMGVRQDYYNRAQDIRDNINFDQLILEYFGVNPWLHISSDPDLHRGKINTQVSSAPSYAPGLVLLG